MITHTLALDSRARAAERFAADSGIETDYLALRAAGNQAVTAALMETPTIADAEQLRIARRGMALHLLGILLEMDSDDMQTILSVHFTNAIEAYFNA